MSDLEMYEELHSIITQQNDIILKQQAELMQLRDLSQDRLIDAAEAAVEEADA